MSNLVATPSMIGYEESGLTIARALIWTGDGNDDRNISGTIFQPGLIWAFGRSGIINRSIIDAERGATHYFDNIVAAADATEADGIQAFNSSGFQVGTHDRFNKDGDTFGAWCFEESADAGFAAVSYVGDDNAGRTVAHGLGATPEFFMVIDEDSVKGGQVFHKDLNNSSSPEDFYIEFFDKEEDVNNINRWNDTAPDSTNITLGSGATNNKLNDNFVLYAWAPITGKSFFGKYSGTGAELAITGLGFRPSMVMMNNISNGTQASGAWSFFDSTRGETKRMKFDQNTAEETIAESLKSFDNDGFTLGTSDRVNINTDQYIFGAWK